MTRTHLTLPHVFFLFFPANEGWTHLVNMSSFGLPLSLFVDLMLVWHLFSKTQCYC